MVPVLLNPVLMELKYAMPTHRLASGAHIVAKLSSQRDGFHLPHKARSYVLVGLLWFECGLTTRFICWELGA